MDGESKKNSNEKIKEKKNITNKKNTSSVTKKKTEIFSFLFPNLKVFFCLIYI